MQRSKSRAYYSYDDNTIAISIVYTDGSRKIGILLTLARSKLGLKKGYKLVNKNILQIF